MIKIDFKNRIKKIKNKSSKKGFTLIEIIICIALIAIIGVSTTFVVVKNNKKQQQKLLDRYATTFDNALEVYLSNHQEITDNLNDTAKAAAITLEVLKNDGLIDKVDGIDEEDYKKYYYLLSNAKLLSKDETTTDIECDNDVVGIEIFKSWNLGDADDVIYVCPKDTGSNNSNSNNDTKELEDRISKLETIIQRMNFNDNNFVIFDVNSDTSDLAYFPDNGGNNETGDYNDIWRIVQNSSNLNTDKYTLMYNQPILTNYRSLFPTVKDIEGYDSDLLIDTSKKKRPSNYATSFDNCKNKKYITNKDNDKVYEVSAAVLGDWYGYDSDGDLGKIQGLYKYNDNYYTTSYSSRYSCYYLNKIDDVDAYIGTDIEYSFLKKDSSFKSYYFSGNSNYSLNLINEKNNLDYISMFDLRSTNPFKEALYNSINSNFNNHIQSTKKSYKYSLISSTNSLIPDNDNNFNETFLRTLTKQEAEDNKSWLSTFSMPIGLYTGSWYGINNISYIDNIVSKAKKTPKTLNYVYTNYGELTYNTNNVVYAYKASTIEGNSSSIYLSSRNPSYSVKTAKYYPVIDLNDVSLIIDYNNYSSKYKDKRSNCTQEKLGTQECPYLLKIGNYYSDGTQYQ